MNFEDFEPISDEVLIAMERDGWTPDQVRRLIMRYREQTRIVRLTRAEAQEARDALRDQNNGS